MKRHLVFATVVVLSLVASGLLLAQSNPGVGTWQFTPAKSKYSPAELTPKSGTQTVTAQGDGLKISYELVGGDGSHFAYSFTTNRDGKDSAIAGVGAPGGADTVAIKRVDANTDTVTLKKAGKVIRTGRVVVSKDGKVKTITVKGDDQGKPVSSTSVWEKQ